MSLQDFLANQRASSASQKTFIPPTYGSIYGQRHENFNRTPEIKSSVTAKNNVVSFPSKPEVKVSKNNVVSFHYETKATLKERMERAIGQIKDLAAKEIMTKYSQGVLKIQDSIVLKPQQKLVVDDFTNNLINSVAELYVLPTPSAFVDSLRPQLSVPLFDIISTHFPISFDTVDAIAGSIEQIYEISGYNLDSLDL